MSRKYRKITLVASLPHIAKAVVWWRDSGIPFRGKLPHLKWVSSKKVVKFMGRYKDLKADHRHTKFNIQLRSKDYALAKATFDGKVIRYVKKRERKK